MCTKKNGNLVVLSSEGAMIAISIQAGGLIWSQKLAFGDSLHAQLQLVPLGKVAMDNGKQQSTP